MTKLTKLVLELVFVILIWYAIRNYTILTPVTQILRYVLYITGFVHIIVSGIKYTR